MHHARKVLVLLLLANSAYAQDGEEAYRKSVDFVTQVVAVRSDWTTDTGSAVVINSKGDMLTAYHVIEKAGLVSVIFPAKKADGQVIGDAAYYTENYSKLLVPCIVVAKDSKRDLALLRPLVPKTDARSANFATRVSPGQSLFAIGSGGDTRFRYSSGAVKQTYEGRFTTPRGTTEGAIIDSTTDFTPGDSGGPLMNMKGDVVGINLATEPSGIRKSIAASEAKAFIDATLMKPTPEPVKSEK